MRSGEWIPGDPVPLPSLAHYELGSWRARYRKYRPYVLAGVLAYMLIRRVIRG